MVVKRQSRVKSRPKGKALYFLLFTFCFSLVLCGRYLFAAERNDPPASLRKQEGPARYRVEVLKNISAGQGKKYLAELGIGTASQLPGTNTLLVTAQPAELAKASAVLRLVDTKQQFVIKPIFPACQAQNLPSNDTIAAEVGNISIGTFSAPPTPGAAAKAIIDVHNDAVVAIAPVIQLEKIISVIEKQLILQGSNSAESSQNEDLQAYRKAQIQRPQKTKTAANVLLPAEPNKLRGIEPNQILLGAGLKDANKPETIQVVEAELHKIASPLESQQLPTDTNDTESDELFDRLLDSLAESEKRIAEQPQQPSQPNNVTVVPEPNALSEPVTDSNQAEQPAPESTEQPQQSRDVETSVKGPPTEAESTLQEKPEIQTQFVEPTPIMRAYEPEPITGGEEELELDLPEKLEIVALLDFVGKYLDLDYMYDPTKVKGDVALKVQGPIKVKELYPLLESVMKFKGFVMTRKGNLVTIVPQDEALNIDPALYTDAGKVEYGDVIITRIFKLNYIDPDSAKNLLTGMKLGVSAEPIPGTQSIAVTDYAYRIPRIEKVLQMVDLPGKPRRFRFRQLKYTMAKTLAPKIETLAEQLGTVTITFAEPTTEITRKRGESSRAFAARKAKAEAERKEAPGAEPSVYLDTDERTNRILMIGFEEQLNVVDELIDTLDVEQQDLRTMRLYEIKYVGAEEIREKLAELGIISTAGVTPTTRRDRATRARAKGAPTPPEMIEEPLVEEPQVVIIEATNSLLVNATPEQHAQIVMIIGYMDVEPEQAAINYVVYPLENQDPEDLAAVLNQLIRETITSEGAKGDKIQQTTTTVRKIEEDITIIPDPKTYSLIVYASKKNQQWISSLIRQLDEYRPQVLLDVTLVEITKNDQFNLDLNLISKFPKLKRSQALDANGMPTGIPTGTMDYLKTALLDPFPLKRITEATAIGGFGTGFYADEHIQALLEVMDQKGYGRVMARPKLLVNDNEPGTIRAEETTYVVRTETSYFGVENPQQSQKTIFDPYSAGVTLEITPHISKGDNLRLIISMKRSDFRITEEVIALGKPPDQVTSDVDTVVTVPDGTTIILGGLERLSQSKGGTKVPLLGDIPLVGGLFRSTAKTDVQSRLYVFVKAHILRPGEELTGVSDIEVISRKNRATFEEFERKFQELNEWPGIKPEPMDPLKVLEAD